MISSPSATDVARFRPSGPATRSSPASSGLAVLGYDSDRCVTSSSRMPSRFLGRIMSCNLNSVRQGAASLPWRGRRLYPVES